jgi:hypothetical protein
MELHSTTETQQKKVESKEGMKLFKRLPKIRWQPRQDDSFISFEQWDNYPDLKEDLSLLNDHLLPKFHRYDNKALEAQNSFRRDQLILLIGSATAAILGAIQIALIKSWVPGALETVITISLTVMTYIVRSFNKQRGYFTDRLIAETLRGEYYLFLGRIGEYADEEKRLQHLKRRVSEITSQQSQPREMSRLSSADISNVEAVSRDQQFLDLYKDRRYFDQIAYYEGRQKEFEEAHNEFVILSAILMGLTALMSFLSSFEIENLKIWFALLAVIFPTLSAALSTYTTLYAFERQAKIYHDAFSRLESAEHKLIAASKSRQEIVDFVNEVEKVFLEERGQWGLLADIKLPEPPM